MNSEENQLSRKTIRRHIQTISHAQEETHKHQRQHQCLRFNEIAVSEHFILETIAVVSITALVFDIRTMSFDFICIFDIICINAIVFDILRTRTTILDITCIRCANS
jgi:hypothetical protein